jgi:hypothetical protein
MKWLIDFIVICVGALLVVKTQWFYDFTGPIAWAEQHLGSEGGTRLLIKMIGVLMIIGVMMAITGLLQAIIRGIFGGLLQ